MSNWIDRFIGEVGKITDTPFLFIRAAAYFTAASALRKQVYYWTNKKIYANLYYLFVAPPAKFRKTTVLETAQDILHSECGLAAGVPLVSDSHFLPQDGSDVALDDALGEAGGYGIWYYEEFAKFVGSAKRENTSQTGIKFLEYFNPTSIDKKTKTRKDGDRVISKGSVINFISACTDEDFELFMTSNAVSSGQLSRMLIFRPTNEDARPIFDTMPEAPPNFFTKMAKELKGLVPNVQTKMSATKAAKETFAECQREMEIWYNTQSNSIFLRKATSRVTTILERLSMIHAAMRGSMTIDDVDVENPLKDIIFPYLRAIKGLNRFGYLERPDQMLRARIYRSLENGRPSTVYTLARDLNESVNSIVEATKTLIDQDHVYVMKSEGFTFYMVHDENDHDRNTKLAKAERATKIFRSKLQEEKVKATKLVQNGAVYSAQQEEEVL